MDIKEIDQVRQKLLASFNELDDKSKILKATELKGLYAKLPMVSQADKASLGRAINELKAELENLVKNFEAKQGESSKLSIDITAPMDVNSPMPELFVAERGSIHPLMHEIEKISDIFYRMGYVTEESREIDDQFHMFESLNFPKGHPARDDWDTFMTEETDVDGERLIAPAHTSTMQNRVLKKYRSNLARGEAIAAIVPDRTFRNEDLDARHEHTFYQVEGVYVAKGVNVGNLIVTLQEFLQEYYGKKLKVRVNPFYFPFTEPSFEFALSCPFCEGISKVCRVCSGEGWVELLGCGMIHPNVLRFAEIDSEIYTGFAFGCGVDRLVMMKYQIEDIRHLESGKLDFLRQF